MTLNLTPPTPALSLSVPPTLPALMCVDEIDFMIPEPRSTVRERQIGRCWKQSQDKIQANTTPNEAYKSTRSLIILRLFPNTKELVKAPKNWDQNEADSRYVFT